jgi:transposase-like protein
MKTELLPTPEDLNLDEIHQRFSSDETAREYIESLLWPNGAVCPHCSNSDQEKIWKIKPNPKKKIRAGLHRCAACNREFTVTVGTIFEDSHIPLRKWLVAFYLICSSKKGISSLQLQRMLPLGSYRSALFMSHRIRHAIKDEAFTDKLTGTIEADETYVGVRAQDTASKRRKIPVVTLLERGGRVRSQVVKNVTGKNLKDIIRKNVEICSDVNTDDYFGYRGLEPKFNHYVVKHSAKEYARHEKGKLMTTNAVEGFFSLLKRGVVGTFHHISEQHLPLYLAEFDHRHNTRFLTDGERTVLGIKKAEGKRLHYRMP